MRRSLAEGTMTAASAIAAVYTNPARDSSLDATPPVVIHSTSHPGWLALTLQKLYPIGKVLDCKLLRTGQTDSFYVFAGKRPYIARIYRAGRDVESILYEMDALIHLATKGCHVSTPIATAAGDAFIKLRFPEGVRHLCLFTFAEGRSMERSVDDAHAYGIAMSSMHEAMEDFTSPHKRRALDISNLLDDSVATLSAILWPRAEVIEFITRFTSQLRVRLDALEPLKRRDGFCHGDLHGGNARISDTGVVTLYDFDSCGPGWPLYDLSVFRWETWSSGCNDDVWDSFIKGYRTKRSIDDSDIHIIDTLSPIRCLWTLALSLSGGDVWGYEEIGDDFVDNQLDMLAQWSDDMSLT